MGAGHDRVFDVLRMISARAVWAVNSRDFSSVQIRFEPDVLASYLHGNAALGPLQALVNVRWGSLEA